MLTNYVTFTLKCHKQVELLQHPCSNFLSQT